MFDYRDMLSISEKGPYDQFLLFGDSITQQSASQDRGFAFMPALQNGKPCSEIHFRVIVQRFLLRLEDLEIFLFDQIPNKSD